MVTAVTENRTASTYERMLAAAVLIAGTAASAVVWFFNPSNFNFFPVCPLYAYTGFACPGCGLTRGFHALFHGDIPTALGFNALIPLYLIAFGFIAATLLSLAIRGRGLIKFSLSPVLLVGMLVLLLTFGVVRNLPFYPFTLLYP